jgi:tellurite methyltransferase
VSFGDAWRRNTPLPSLFPARPLSRGELTQAIAFKNNVYSTKPFNFALFNYLAHKFQPMPTQLQELYGNIDIYLFDQLLKGTYTDCQNILDAGCGGGRNLVYFLRNGHNVFGIDPNPEAIDGAITLSASLAPANSSANFRVAPAEDIPFNDGHFDLVISSAVLHFAQSPAHFDSMVRSMWRVLKPGGYLFARLASDIGIETLVVPIGNGRYLLPDGSERFLVNENLLLSYNKILNAHMYEPIKTTNVQNLRCMTTWCLQKV